MTNLKLYKTICFLALLLIACNTKPPEEKGDKQIKNYVEISAVNPNYSSFEIYDPWENKWSNTFTSSNLPESVNFVRSLLLKVRI